MDFQIFRENVTVLGTETGKFIEAVASPHHKFLLKNITVLITNLSNFLEDSQNIEVLSDYDKKPEVNKNSCPLDILCKDILVELGKIEALLVSKNGAFQFMINQESQTLEDEMSLDEIRVALEDLFAKKLLSAFDMLKYLRGHNKTLILLGANGSGKTSFANYLRNVETHVKVIPASKPIKIMGPVELIYNSTVEAYSNEIFQGGDLNENLLQKLIVGLCTEHDAVARKFYNGEEIKGEKTLFEKVKRIFDDFFEVKLDNSNFGNKQIQASKNGGTPFPFNKMSDGERVAFFYIATVIVAPPQSFIVVDEPENHLNPAVYNKIWDRLMKERSDCQFIFISHTIDFINARTEVELVKIKEFTYPDKFDFEFLGDTLEEINSDFIVEVVGSRKPILFCEGSKTSYDYKVYENLFGDKYTVIPTGNCSSVENSVVACNAHATTYGIQSAVGIVDSDLKSDEKISQLRLKRVYALNCNEIEMLLLDEAIFKRVLAQIYKTDAEFVAFKAAFFAKLDKRKEHIIKRLVKTQIDEKLQSSVIDDRSNKTQQELKSDLTRIFGEINIDTLWGNCNAKITDIIKWQDYDAALKYCCLEHTEIIDGVGRPFVTDYVTIALGVLQNDSALAVEIKEKYFADFNL